MKIFFLIFLLSCSTSPDQDHIQIKYSTVDSSSVINNKIITSIDTNQRTEGQMYGPTPLGEISQDISHVKSPLITGLFFGPCLYSSYNYIDFLKILEERGFAVHVLSGVGVGAIIASLFAKGVTPELIEWKLFKLFKALSKDQAYSENWLAKINQFIDLEFKNDRMENLNKVLVLKLYNIRTKNLESFIKGNLAQFLKLNFVYSVNILSPLYTSPLVTNQVWDNTYLLTKVDKLIFVSSYNRNKLLNDPNDFIFGVYTKIFGKLNTMLNSNDNIYSVVLPNGGLSMDTNKRTNTARKFLLSKIDDIDIFYSNDKQLR